MSFALSVGELAEAEDHHPEILMKWGKVRVTWWTHAVNGLHLNDFICAAKTDQLAGQ
jgi:4a-hydroxytetrahydrobiopterin dehydratase